MMNAARIMSGNYGEVWLDNEYVGEAYKLNAKITYNKEDINRCGGMMVDTKVTSQKGTGSMGLYKVSSRMARTIGNSLKNGKDARFTVISKLSDPDAYGTERVMLTGVSFDDLTLADWEAAVVGRVEAPFTFTDYEFLDMVED